MSGLQDLTVPIKYIGKKKEKFDTVNHTGTTWKPGETQFYPASIAKGLLMHVDIWRLGKREDVHNTSADSEAVVAAQNRPDPDKGEGTALHPADRVPQSALTKDTEKGAGAGARGTLE